MKLININLYEPENSFFQRFVFSELLTNLEDWCKANDYFINDTANLSYDWKRVHNGIVCRPMTEYIKLCNSCVKLAYRPTFQRVNALLADYSKFMELETPISIYKSEKEMKIQEARSEWKRAMAKAEQLRLAYQKEKGDFYKQQLEAAQIAS